MDGDADDIVSLDLDLSGMQPAAHIHTEWAHPLDDRRGAPYGAGGSVEGREKSVAQSLHLTAAKSGELLADRVVMSIAEKTPAAVPEFGSTLR